MAAPAAGLFIRKLEWPAGQASAHDVFARAPQQFAALLEDAAGGGRQFLVSRAGRTISTSSPLERQGFFSQWKQQLASVLEERDAGMGIRCLVYAAYEAGGLLETLPAPRTTPPGPLLWLLLPDWSCCFVPEEEVVYLVSARDEAQLDAAESILLNASERQGANAVTVEMDSVSVSDPDSYRQAVRRVKDYIRAGDIFQANIARFWNVPMAASQLPALYAHLRQVNPAPFSCFVRIEAGDDLLHIVSASPERLFRISADGMVETRPIAGTRKRSSGIRDDQLRQELLLSDKERAEHIMLLDLERNDLGRVCRPGTIHVNEHMAIERYATVQHIVSNVRGELGEGMDAADVFCAMFPGGTITGCPKVRCMEIIHELEPGARGPYTGGIGYVAWDGSADMNILIRTFWHHRKMLHWAAGAGIVADSSPEHELRETGYKAAGLLWALSRPEQHA
ncbi:MAG: anthranilate synthase component I family protein [Mariprofundaceae bacterium]|nr:anthranilate synthase component I family protein [Mariprofundaceae bacterium]